MPPTLSPDLARAFAQLRPILSNPRFWLSLVCGGAALGIAGPFGTFTALPLGPRLAYWIVMILGTGCVGLILCRSMTTVLQGRGLPRRLASVLSGLLAGLPIVAMVHGLNSLLLPPDALAIGPIPLTLALLVISVCVSLAVAEIFFSRPAPPSPAHPTPAPATAPAPAHSPTPPQPRLLARLPAHLRGPLIALTATDHYTEVTTAHGTARLLLRLSDAIAETAPTPGLRIHRSHWVALDQIASARRDGPRAVITLSDGSTRPVSRGFLPAVEQAGLLPPR
ncbi:LytTR family DNA-binding domain-containing protein [Paragemmobacter ruber]|uniref:HTH LytTR-type domain-containing protein n=1 Tax=Paragemmobacter ruber TaxID=1985673 RepID=A0ABW9Y6D5_9RHOB|nr:LytTR family DNA-binding domain-containing protein [Rhodobacter ruber]NBE08131.1 hypothetical protein [Rhodobacter ruber]